MKIKRDKTIRSKNLTPSGGLSRRDTLKLGAGAALIAGAPLSLASKA